MTKEEIDSIHIEHRGVQRYWNITMFVVPLPCKISRSPRHDELVAAADNVLRDAKGLGKEWIARNAEVMAWSSDDERGILTPYRFRVTLDMVTKDMEEQSDEDE